MTSTFTLYSTPWCGYCHRLKGQLKREGIEFDEVDIEAVPDAAGIVEKANNGNPHVLYHMMVDYMPAIRDFELDGPALTWIRPTRRARRWSRWRPRPASASPPARSARRS